MAATLALGPTSPISHASAAALWGLNEVHPNLIHVTVPGGGRDKREGICAHRARSLHADDRAICRSIPVTSVARTLVDLAGMLGVHALRRRVEAADRRKLLDLRVTLAACARANGKRGVWRLRALLADYAGPPDTVSELEDLLQDLVRDFGIPAPLGNFDVAGWSVDAVWPAAKLAIELDSWEFHGHRGQFRRDHRKGLAVAGAGYELLRLGQPELTSARAETARYLLERLGTPASMSDHYRVR
jgi:hypothetical protein